MQNESFLSAALSGMTLENSESLFGDLPKPVDDLAWLKEHLAPGNTLGSQPPPLPVAQLIEVSKIAQSLKKRYDKMFQERDGVLLKRDQAIYEWDSSHYKVAFIRESSEDLSRELEIITNSMSASTDIDGVKRLKSQLHSDCDAFQEQIGKAQELEAKLAESESRLQRKEDQFMKTAQKLLKSIDALGLPPSHKLVSRSEPQHTSPRYSSTHSEAREQLHPSVAMYYDKIADLKIMRDRVLQIHSDFEEEREDRSFRQGLGENVDSSNDEFLSGFKSQYGQALIDVQAARHAAEAALAACKRDGVDSQINNSFVTDGVIDFINVVEGVEDDNAAAFPITLILDPPEQLSPGLMDRDRIVSSSRLTHQTGPLYSTAQYTVNRRQALCYNPDAVQRWMQDIDEAAPPEHLETSQSTPDLRENPTITEVAEAQIHGAVLEDSDWENLSHTELFIQARGKSIPLAPPLPQSQLRRRASSEPKTLDSRNPMHLGAAVTHLRSQDKVQHRAKDAHLSTRQRSDFELNHTPQ